MSEPDAPRFVGRIIGYTHTRIGSPDNIECSLRARSGRDARASRLPRRTLAGFDEAGERIKQHPGLQIAPAPSQRQVWGPGRGIVYEPQVSSEDVLGSFTDRREDEVVLDRSTLRMIRRLGD